MSFRQKYPATLNELLTSPVVFQESLASALDLPLVSANGMRDLAEYGGYSPGAIRTAMSRLRTSGTLEFFVDGGGVTRYRQAPLARSISHAVQRRHERQEGFVLGIFSFASEDVRERQTVRDTLKLHGFQKLAQNVYINGQIDTREIKDVLKASGLLDHVYFFRCHDDEDPVLTRKLTDIFDVAGRKKLLKRYHDDLLAFLDERGISGDEAARRLLFAGPTYYQITFIDEPPLPRRYLPDDYPLERLSSLMATMAVKHGQAVAQYFRRVNV